MKSILLIIFSFAVATLQAQTFEWAKSMGGTSDDIGYSIGVDATGNVYTTGEFRGTADFDPGAGTANLTSQGGRDIFVQKLDANGNFLWAKSMGGTDDDIGNSIDVDVSGNVFTTGIFKGTVDFDPGVGTANLTSQGSFDIFVQKLDANGNFMWAKSVGRVANEFSYSISIDASGNVYTTGEFSGVVDFDPGVGTANLTSLGGFDIFVQKLDANGNFLWAKSVGGGGSDVGKSISVDSSGNVYTTGEFRGTADLDPGPGTANHTSQNNSKDIFIQKLNANGNFLWAKSMGGPSDDFCDSINVDASGNVHTTGGFRFIVDFDPGAGIANLTSQGALDIFVQKLDSNGNFLWAKSMGGTFDERGYSMSVDASGNVYTTGFFFGTVDFDPGAGIANLSSQGNYDIFVQNLDANGNFLWAISTGGDFHDIGYSVKVDTSGNIFTTGRFSLTVDFDPGAGTTNLTSEGLADIFILKMNQTIMGIDMLENKIKVGAYPNPTTGIVLVALDKAINNVELVLANVQGKVISRQMFETLSNTDIELPNQTGIYLLTIKTPVGQTSIKLVKE